MQNPFIIVRFVFLALLVYLSLVSLIFASWNAHITSLSGKDPSSAVAFVIFNSIATLILVALSLLDLVWRKATTSLVKFECSWTAVSVVLQIAAAVSVTVNSFSGICQAGSDWSSCASANLVVLSTWLGSFTLLAYFLMLFITSVMHMYTYPDIWSTSVFAVKWFPQRPCNHDEIMSKTEVELSVVTGDDEEERFRDSWGRYWPFKRREVESGRDSDQQSQQSTRPKWSKALTIRRGIDQPFSRKGTLNSTTSGRGTKPPSPTASPTGSNLLLPPRQSRTRESLGGRSEGSRYVELFRESILPPIPITQPDTLSYYGLALDGPSRVDSHFPLRVEDSDKPIPLPRLSEWIRADVEKGINVHSVPPISP